LTASLHGIMLDTIPPWAVRLMDPCFSLLHQPRGERKRTGAWCCMSTSGQAGYALTKRNLPLLHNMVSLGLSHLEQGQAGSRLVRHWPARTLAQPENWWAAGCSRARCPAWEFMFRDISHMSVVTTLNPACHVTQLVQSAAQ